MAQAHQHSYELDDALTLLEHDHRTVEQLFAQLERTTDIGDRGEIVAEIVKELDLHARIEEQIVYPAVRRAVKTSEDLVEHSEDEHDAVRRLLDALAGMDPTDPGFDPTWREVRDLVVEHVREEEGEMFPLFRAAVRYDELQELARTIIGFKGGSSAAPTGQAG